MKSLCSERQLRSSLGWVSLVTAGLLGANALVIADAAFYDSATLSVLGG